MKHVDAVRAKPEDWLHSAEHSVALSLMGPFTVMNESARQRNADWAVNPEEVDDTKKLSTACALCIRDYMQTKPDGELGCMIRAQGDLQFELIPFENTDPSWYSVRLGTDQDFLRMAELYRAGGLWGWAHSHPGGWPYPSITDLEQHSLCINMVIYGGAKNLLSIYSTAEINRLHEATRAAAAQAHGCRSSSAALDQWLKGKE